MPTTFEGTIYFDAEDEITFTANSRFGFVSSRSANIGFAARAPEQLHKIADAARNAAKALYDMQAAEKKAKASAVRK